MKTMITLIKREIWEYKNTLLTFSAIIAGILIVFGLFSLVLSLFPHHFSSTLTSTNVRDLPDNIVSLGFYGIATPFAIVLWLMVFNYFLSTLYDDRKDGSILFWQSMPIATPQTIIAKCITPLVIAPLVISLVVAITTIIVLFLFGMAMGHFTLISLASFLHPLIFLKTWVSMASALILQGLWLFPLFGWCMLCSAWAKKKPFMYAIVFPIMAIIIEFLFNSSHYVAHFISTHISQAGIAWGKPFLWLSPDLQSQLSTNLNTNALTKIMATNSNTYDQLFIGLAIGLVFIIIAGILRSRCYRFDR